MPDSFTAEDRAQLAAHGLSVDEAARQLALLRSPPPPTRVVRPATVGDGIVHLSESRNGALLDRFEAAAAAGRCGKLVPASGAASRMFKSLVAARDGDTAGDQAVVEQVFATLDRFAFRDQLAAVLEARGTCLREALQNRDHETMLAALLDSDGLGFGKLPKALIPFHRGPEGVRTAFIEHLVEAAGHVRDAAGCCRLHFTVAPRHEGAFEAHLEACRGWLEPALEARFEVSFSSQDPATDTLTAELDGSPARRPNGRLLLRPGGHGALIHNLGLTDGDILFIKNIDNILPDARRAVVVQWKKLLAGYLLQLEERIFAILNRLDDGDADGTWLEDALRFTADKLLVPAARAYRMRPPDEIRRFLHRRLARPLRVCGMVPKTDEPGGGPFWVRTADGSESVQIVEMAQIDRHNPEQEALVRSATHFNPVDLVCAVRDHHGQPYDLPRYIDPSTVFIARKPQGGRTIQALEHPGLWNGAMAGWNTVFVEVPAATFAPVKSVLDLLRPAHQPQRDD